MPSDLIPEQFTDFAMEEILEYLRVHREDWENKTGEELDAFKEDMEMILFNTDIKFLTRTDCTEFIDESADLIFFVVDYVAEMDQEFGTGQEKSLVAQFNRCYYYTGMEMIRDEWDDLTDKFYDQTDTDSDEPMEG
jgi:hypothetical protein